MTGIDKDISDRIKVATGEIAAGSLVDGRFEVDTYLGAGGMCDVYKATHRQMDKAVALKFLKPALCTSPQSIERFLREAKTLSAIHHPNVVEVYSVGIFNNRPFIAMEFLDGKSLAQMLLEQPQHRLGQKQAIPVFLQICDGLAHCHAAGVLHRDLKPSNVMLVDGGKTVKLVDFGIAKALPQAGKDFEKLTQSGALLGSLHYMSPEQCQGGDLDERSDVYSLGCLMYETLVGDLPFTAVNPFAVLTKHLSHEPQQSPFLNNAVGAVVLSTMAKDPADRPPSAEALKQLLLKPPEYRRRWRPAIAPAGLAFAVAMVAGAAIIYFSFVPNADRQQTDEFAKSTGTAGQDSIDWLTTCKAIASERARDDRRARELCAQVLRCAPEQIKQRKMDTPLERKAVQEAVKVMPNACFNGNDWKSAIRWEAARQDVADALNDPKDGMEAQVCIGDFLRLVHRDKEAIAAYLQVRERMRKIPRASVPGSDYEVFFARAFAGIGYIYLERSKHESGQSKISDLQKSIDNLRLVTGLVSFDSGKYPYSWAETMLTEARAAMKAEKAH